MAERIVLETARTILRPFQITDGADLYEFSRERRVADAAGWPPHKSVEDSQKMIVSVFSAPHTFAVVEKGSGKVIGSAGFTAQSRGSFASSDEIGYALHPDWWGRGIMTEVVRELIRYGFMDRELEAIWCSHYVENPASRRVIEKCGFSYVTEETLMDHTGEHRTRFYVLLRQQWKGAGHG